MREDERENEDSRRRTSLDPRPKPAMTVPSMRKGYGGAGPESGPTMVGREDMASRARVGPIESGGDGSDGGGRDNEWKR